MTFVVTPQAPARDRRARPRQIASAAQWAEACRGASFGEIRAVAADPSTAPPGGASPARAAAMVRSIAVGGTNELDSIYF